MNKSQMLILLAIVALAVYYFSAGEKATQKPSNQSLIKPSSLPPSLPIKPFSLPVHKPPNCPPTQIKPLSAVLPSEIMAKKSQSTITMPTNLPEKEPVYFPSAEFVLAPNDPDDYCRQQVLNFLEDWLASFSNPQQKSKIAQVISLLQAENKARSEYLQALWSLRAMEGFEFYVGQSFREWVGLPVEKKPTYEPLDTGWLTDDNLEFILKNHAGIKAALAQRNQASKLFHLRTDLANVYNAFYKAKSKQDWPLPEFLQELEWNKAQYTLFPWRVNGNHWGLFILKDLAWGEEESAYQVWYTSSGGESLEVEREQLKPFVEQICGEVEIKVIEPKDRESKGYECGVYLVKYVEEVLESGALELKRQYTAADCQEFRWEWKERIGEKWCCWD